MNEQLQKETRQLIQSWMRHDSGLLRTYLVQDVEDPRINIQSILTRHFIVTQLFGDAMAGLCHAELQFASVLNWFQRLQQAGTDAEEFCAVAHALSRGADNAEGLPIPGFVRAAYKATPCQVNSASIPNYIGTILNSATSGQERAGVETVVDQFERIWSAVLAPLPPSNASLLEIGCGSANDYRFFESFGLARLFSYTGIDLCLKNVLNAKQLFPSANFAVGNAFALGVGDRTFDFAVVHDLFEHLSPEALELAIDEICRVTRTSLSIGFFNLHEAEDHIVRPLDAYHWNQLSLPRLTASFARRGWEVSVVHIATWLRWRLGCDETHNPNAYTFFATRTERGTSA